MGFGGTGFKVPEERELLSIPVTPAKDIPTRPHQASASLERQRSFPARSIWPQFGGISLPEASNSNGGSPVCFTFKASGVNPSQNSRLINPPEASASNGVSSSLVSKGYVDQKSSFNYFHQGLVSNGGNGFVAAKGSADQNNRFFQEVSASKGVSDSLASKGSSDQNSRFSTSNGVSSCLAPKGSADQYTRFSISNEVSASNKANASLAFRGAVDQNSKFSTSSGVSASFALKGTANQNSGFSSFNGGSACLAPKGFVDQSSKFFQEVSPSNGVSACLAPKGSADQNSRFLPSNGVSTSVAPKGSADQNSRFLPSNGVSASLAPKGYSDQNSRFLTSNGVSTSVAPKGSADQNNRFLPSNGVSASLAPKGSADQYSRFLPSNGVSTSVAPKGSADQNSRFLHSNGVSASLPPKGSADQNIRFLSSNGVSASLAPKGYSDQNSRFLPSNGVSTSVAPNGSADQNSRFLPSNGVSASLASKGYPDQNSKFLPSNGVSTSVAPNGSADQNIRFLPSNGVSAFLAPKASADQNNRFLPSNGVTASLAPKGSADQNNRFLPCNGVSASLPPKGSADQDSRFLPWNGVSASLPPKGSADQNRRFSTSNGVNAFLPAKGSADQNSRFCTSNGGGSYLASKGSSDQNSRFFQELSPSNGVSVFLASKDSIEQKRRIFPEVSTSTTANASLSKDKNNRLFPEALTSNGTSECPASKGSSDQKSKFFPEVSTSNVANAGVASKGSADHNNRFFPEASNGLRASFTSKGSADQNSKFFSEASNGVRTSFTSRGSADQNTRVFPEVSASNGVSSRLASKSSIDQNSRFNNFPEDSTSKSSTDQNSKFSYLPVASTSSGVIPSLNPKGFVDQTSRIHNWDATMASGNLILNHIANSSTGGFVSMNVGSNSAASNLTRAASANGTDRGRKNGESSPLFFNQINGSHHLFQTKASACQMQGGNNDVVSNPFSKVSHLQNQSNQQQVHSESHTILPVNRNSNMWTNCWETQKAQFFKDSTRDHFTPITPDHAKKRQNQTSEVNVIDLSEEDNDIDHEDGKDEQQALVAHTLDEGIQRSNRKTLSEPVIDSPSTALCTPVKEKFSSAKRQACEIDLNLTPEQKSEQKPKRKKHRPKVVIEGKPKRTPKVVVAKEIGFKEKPPVKRKYVRRKGLKALNPPATTELTENTSPTAGISTRATRRSLNFDFENQASKENASLALDDQKQQQPCSVDNSLCRPEYNFIHQTQDLSNKIYNNEGTQSILRGIQGLQSIEKHPPATKTFDLNSPSSQMMRDHISFAENPAPATPAPHEKKELLLEHSSTNNEAHLKSTNPVGVLYDSLQVYKNILGRNGYCQDRNDLDLQFPKSCKRKRTEKGQIKRIERTIPCKKTVDKSVGQMMVPRESDSKGNNFTSQGNCGASNLQSNNICDTVDLSQGKRNSNTADGVHNPQKNLLSENPVSQKARTSITYQRKRRSKIMLSLGKAIWKKKKRSSRPTRVRDLASLIAVALCKNTESFHEGQDCIEALLLRSQPKIPKKPRTRRPRPVNSLTYARQKVWYLKRYGAASKHYHQLLAKGLKYTSDDHDPYALVPYQNDSRIVPYEQYGPIREQKPRPKVDLDPESERVFKLLMDSDGSEGLGDTNADKEKWWREERSVFSGRVASFIARMHMVQGDRRYLKWKGSVVDSVIGVFLTQNVTDHFSSSAFMSLAARFPLESSSNHQKCNQMWPKMCIEQPEVAIPDTVDTITWNPEISVESAYFQSFVTYNEGTHIAESGVDNNAEVLHSFMGGSALTCNSIEKQFAAYGIKSNMTRQKTLSEDGMKARVDAVSSQNSGLSSIDSNDSSLQPLERMGSCSVSNSEAEDTSLRHSSSTLDAISSFMDLLNSSRDTMLQEYYSNDNGRMPVCVDTMRQSTQPKGSELKYGRLSSTAGVTPIPFVHVSSFDSFHLEKISDPMALGVEDQVVPGERSRFSLLSTVSEGVDIKAMDCMSRRVCQLADYPTETSIHIKNAPSTSKTGPRNYVEALGHTTINEMEQKKFNSNDALDARESVFSASKKKHIESKNFELNLNEEVHFGEKASDVIHDSNSKTKAGKEKKETFDWDSLRKEVHRKGIKRDRTRTQDSLDWEAVRCADVNEIAETIKARGMNHMLAERIKDFLNRLIKEHETIDLEWLRDVPPEKAKEFLLSIRGLGLKSVECVRLLTLDHHAFPVDTNVARIAVRLGWVPLQPLPEDLQIHLLELYPMLESVQKYLWPRLCTLDQKTLYELHYQMITFGKVFCTKKAPNCNACPLRAECRHFASAFASAKLALPGPEEKGLVPSTVPVVGDYNPAMHTIPMSLPAPEVNMLMGSPRNKNQGPIIEEPTSPEPYDSEITVQDIEDAFYEDPDDIPTIRLNIEQFALNLQNFVQENNAGLQDGDLSKALVALTPDAASIPLPKLKTVTRLRTEHQVYILPDEHPLLREMERREPDDPCYYLLAIWAPGESKRETAKSTQAERCCDSESKRETAKSSQAERCCDSEGSGHLCHNACETIEEETSQIVRGTILIPSKTAMRGSFPLNGTYFQVNEVFADHESSVNPIAVPRNWIWNLERRTVFFGTSVTAIFRGLSTEAIQNCFWRGYVCVRGFEQTSRAPRPLAKRFHIVASRLPRGTNGKVDGRDE